MISLDLNQNKTNFNETTPKKEAQQEKDEDESSPQEAARSIE